MRIPKKVTYNKWRDKDGTVHASGYAVGEEAIDPLTGNMSEVKMISIRENRNGGTAYIEFESGTFHKVNDIDEIIGTDDGH